MNKTKIGSSWYDVTYHRTLRNKDDSLLLGHIDSDKKLIRICNRYCKQTQLHTRFHESTHGIFNEYCIDGDENEVTMMGNAFYAFIIDNPVFIREILDFTECLSAKRREK